MDNMKRIATAMAVIMMTMSLAGCGASGENNSSDTVINETNNIEANISTEEKKQPETQTQSETQQDLHPAAGIETGNQPAQDNQGNVEEQVTKHEHVYDESRKAVTCTESGLIVYTCRECGYSYSEEDSGSPALGHDFTSNTIVTEATEYSPGTRRFICARCGGSEDLAYGYAHKVKAYNGTQTVYGYWDTACEQEILELLNNYRASLGLKTLSTTRTMIETAHTRAKEIAFSYRHDHSRPTNERWRTAYPDDDFCGENIASGQADAQEVTTGWIESPDHNENMVNERFRTIGIGVFVRVDCPESGEVTQLDQKGLSHEDTRFYVQSFAN